MCTINGLYAYHDRAPAVDPAELCATRDHMAASGPDGQGAWMSPDGRTLCFASQVKALLAGGALRPARDLLTGALVGLMRDAGQQDITTVTLAFSEYRGQPADETTAFRPRSPYAVAKATAHWQVANYREAYGLFACTGPLRLHRASSPSSSGRASASSAGWKRALPILFEEREGEG